MNFLYPEVFYMMLIPLILLIVLVLTSKNSMERYFSKDILEKLSVGGKVLTTNTRNGLFFVTLILFIVALSRPVINQKEELFYYPLALGLFFLLLALSSFPSKIFKKNISVFLLAGVYCVPLKVDADIFNFETIQIAKQLYEDKKYDEASNQYRKLPATAQGLYNLGDTLYKQNKYKEAIKSYNKVITKDKELEGKKLHNIGNSYLKLNDLEKAKEFYEKSLKIREDNETRENLVLVTKELEKQKKKKQKNKDPFKKDLLSQMKERKEMEHLEKQTTQKESIKEGRVISLANNEKILYFLFGMLFGGIGVVGIVILKKQTKIQEDIPLVKLVKKTKTQEELLKILVIYIKLDDDLDKMIFTLETKLDNEKFKGIKKEILHILYNLERKGMQLDTKF